jgi:hypothetical protein
MAASTHAKGRATAAFEAMGPTTGGNVICQIVHHSITANLSANDVFQLIKVPLDAVIVNGWIAADAGAGSAFTFTVGDGASANRYVPSSSVSVSQTMQNFVRDLSGATTGLGHKYTAADTIDIKFTAITATVALDFTLAVFYIVDGQTGGVVTS